MNQKDFDLVTRPELDAIEFVAEKLRTEEAAWSEQATLIAAQVANHIRSNAPVHIENEDDEKTYVHALALAREYWEPSLAPHRTQDPETVKT